MYGRGLGLGFGLAGWWDRDTMVLNDREHGVGVLAGCIRGDVVVFRFGGLRCARRCVCKSERVWRGVL